MVGEAAAARTANSTTAVGVEVSDDRGKTMCSQMRDQFHGAVSLVPGGLQTLDAFLIPGRALDGAHLKVCSPGPSTCCTEEMEAGFVQASKTGFRKLVEDKIVGLSHIFKTRTTNFDRDRDSDVFAGDVTCGWGAKLLSPSIVRFPQRIKGDGDRSRVVNLICVSGRPYVHGSPHEIRNKVEECDVEKREMKKDPRATGSRWLVAVGIVFGVDKIYLPSQHESNPRTFFLSRYEWPCLPLLLDVKHVHRLPLRRTPLDDPIVLLCVSTVVRRSVMANRWFCPALPPLLLPMCSCRE
ncbi:unnamed protein product [Soboliphyme baturini]|uniref:Uncharacterized protein n=1 Tax=Soboliphyme baturini TaxID=241478 RepID=A0A183IJN7_9BILA|nr:unnamed protein product [Soboliphyme baturini]